MSPEQARGENVDHRSDIFSLGAVLYEALTGTRPFTGVHVAAVLHRILFGPLVPLRERRPDVPPAVEAIVGRALARDPAARYQTMAHLAADLRAALARSPAAVVRTAGWPVATSGPALAVTEVTRTAPRPTRRTRLAVAGAGLVLVLVVGTALVTQWPSWRSPGAHDLPAAVSAMSLPESPSTAVAYTRHGMELLRRFDRTGQVDQAIDAFESAIGLDAAYAPAWAGLARAFWRQQKLTRERAWGARALDAAQHAVTLDPMLADGHVSVGLAALVAGDLPAAKAALEHALVLHPASADAHRGLGDLAEGEDRLEDAARHYERAVGLAPGDWELPRLAGDIPYKSGRYDDALVWYERAAGAAPDSAAPYRLIGAVQHMRGDYAAAATALQQSIALQPTAGGYTNLGTALFYEGRYREALPAFERAVELMPSIPIMWANLGDAYRCVPGHREQSQEAYARALQLLRALLATDPSHVGNRSNLALYLAKSGETAKALEELRQVLRPDVSEINTIYSAPTGTTAQRRWSLESGYEGLTPGDYFFKASIVVTPQGGGQAFSVDPEMDIET